MRAFSWMALGSIVAVLAGCGSEATTASSPPQPLTGAPGKEGKLGFAYYSNAGKTSCPFGCALMKGTDDSIRFNPAQKAAPVVESSDPAIVEVLSTETTDVGFSLRAHDVGVVELRIKSAEGELLDRVDVGVEIPTQIAFGDAPTTVKIGETINVFPIALGKDGKPLQASRGWEFRGNTPAVASVGNGCVLICYGNNDWIAVKGLTAGKVEATANGAGTEGSLVIEVTP